MISTADVSRAFFEAVAIRNICMELPEEDMTEQDKFDDAVGHFLTSLFGTRDAANTWQEEGARFMLKVGFERGKYNPCLYFNEVQNIKTLVHGDNFVSVFNRRPM